jgi:GT2 family glycosyltransferase/tetratricopeptide (TPR) repeat protein
VSGTVAVFHLHDDDTYLEAAIASVKGSVPVLAFVNKRPWYGGPGDWRRAAETARRSGAEVVVGEWQDEAEHRTCSMKECLARGVRKILVQDGDEVIEPELLDHLLRIAESDLADRVRVRFDTYWKSPEYVIRPPEYIRPIMLIDPRVVWHRWVRDFEGGRLLVLEEEFGKVHHLSYVGPDERVRRKLETWSHKDDVVDNWWTKVWKAWDSDRCLTRLHPTHPDAYGFAERIEVPEALRSAYKRCQELAPRERSEVSTPERWPTLSVVIPVCEQADLLRACLGSLERCGDLVAETIVVDNGSTEDVGAVARSFDGVEYLRNDSNLGFAKASNQGADKASGDVVLFLNSDTLVSRPSLIRLIEPLAQSATVAATGPVSNNCGGFQQTFVTYTDSSRASLFAEDLAAAEREPIEVDMLVGFCLAVRRRALDDVGTFDERFGLGLFEDNDLSYRLRRSGWRLLVVPNAFVHHEGSKTLTKVAPATERLFRENERKFVEKWRGDLESGFASHLSGLAGERIAFDLERKPEARTKEIARKRELADITLCMIVRDEERVLADCLKSAKPFFKETIIVDTGSKDSTVEIARSFGAEVRTMEWPDSFAAARNESLRGAKGRWIFWMDADDTLPRNSGEAVLDAAINASEDVHGFVVPVQFVEESPNSGTRVDHVKLFRNLPGLRFEGRIHEQILESLRSHGGHIERCAAYVLHSGYDTSPEGQEKKRARDERLLMLDLQDRPGHPFVLFNLGMTAHHLGDHQKAIEWLEKCLAVARPTESIVRKTYSMLAVSLRETGRLEDAVATLRKGLKSVGEDPELRFQMGLMLTAAGSLEEAAESYEQALCLDTSGFLTSIDIGILGFKTRHNLAGVYASMGRRGDAKRHLRQALKDAPTFMQSVFLLFDLSILDNEFETAKEMMERVRCEEGPSGNWIEMLIKYSEATGGPDKVPVTLEQSVGAGADESTVTRACGRWALRRGDTAYGVRILSRIAERDAESSYYLGVEAMRRGCFEEALDWMQRSASINPGHEDTARQVESLKSMLGAGAGDVQ